MSTICVVLYVVLLVQFHVRSVAVQTCPRTFLHTCMWVPLVRRKPFTVSDIPRSAHKFNFHERDVKLHVVRAVTKPKQPNQLARQTQETHAQKRRIHHEYYNTSRMTKQTSSDRIMTERCDIQCSCMCLHNASCVRPNHTQLHHTCVRPHASHFSRIATTDTN